MYLPNSRWTWAFLLVAVAQAIISLALEGYVFGEFQASLQNDATSNHPPTAALTIPTYLTLFIFGFLYEVALVWDALRLKNTIQVIGICIYNLGMLVYAAAEMNQLDDAVTTLLSTNDIEPNTRANLRPFLIAAPCVIALGTILQSFLAWKIYDEFAWTIYKHISADVRLKRRYLTYQIYIALLKFDFYFFLGFTVQFIVVVGHQGTSNAEYYLTIAAIPITVILLFVAAYFTRRESYIGQSGCIAVYFAAMAYFIFKLVRMYHSSKSIYYLAARKSLTIFAILTVLLLVVTITTAFVCMRNFNKGLKPHIQRRKVPDVDEANYSKYDANGSFNGSQHQMGPVQTRMTID